MGSDFVIVIVLIGLYILGIALMMFLIKRDVAQTYMITGIYILLFIALGIMPIILMKLNLIGNSTFNVVSGITYFITFVCFASMKLINKSVINQSSPTGEN